MANSGHEGFSHSESEDFHGKERKQILRLLIEDVTLKKTTQGIEVHVCFKGGQTRSLHLDLPKKATELRITEKHVIVCIRKLSKKYTDQEIAEILNRQGYTTHEKKKFTKISVSYLRQSYNIKSYRDNLRDKGYLTAKELAEKLKISHRTIYTKQKAGLLKGIRCSGGTELLYKLPSKKVRVAQKKQRK